MNSDRATRFYRAKKAILTLGVAGVALTSPGCSCGRPRNSTDVARQRVSVDVLAAHPGQYRGTADVVGRVAWVDEASRTFGLGCEDVCLTLPVSYLGTMPRPGAMVEVTGKVERTADGRYLLAASEVKSP